jgi:hypothetical protein
MQSGKFYMKIGDGLRAALNEAVPSDQAAYIRSLIAADLSARLGREVIDDTPRPGGDQHGKLSARRAARFETIIARWDAGYSLVEAGNLELYGLREARAALKHYGREMVMRPLRDGWTSRMLRKLEYNIASDADIRPAEMRKLAKKWGIPQSEMARGLSLLLAPIAKESIS